MCLLRGGSEAVYQFQYYFRRQHCQKIRPKGQRVILLTSVLMKSYPILNQRVNVHAKMISKPEFKFLLFQPILFMC